MTEVFEPGFWLLLGLVLSYCAFGVVHRGRIRRAMDEAAEEVAAMGAAYALMEQKLDAERRRLEEGQEYLQALIQQEVRRQQGPAQQGPGHGLQGGMGQAPTLDPGEIQEKTETVLERERLRHSPEVRSLVGQGASEEQAIDYLMGEASFPGMDERLDQMVADELAERAGLMGG